MGKSALVVQAFDVIEPRGEESPVVVEVPHAGVHVDPESLAWTIAPARSIGRDADLYVDALFQDAPAEGATLVTARLSRFVVDLNRSEADCDAEAVEGGGSTPWPRGLIWRLTTDGAPVLAGRLPRRELHRRLESVYRPYHAALHALLARKLERFGAAVLLCAHSMPSTSRQGFGAPTPRPAGDRPLDRPAPAPPLIPRADVVPGTRGRTTAASSVIDEVDRHCRAHGLSVRHDDPYKGGFATAHYGRPDRSIHAVQIEIARRLYMDEQSLTVDARGFAAVREFGRTLVARLSSVELLRQLRQNVRATRAT
ncbi:MAG: N-formylglutamate amidohydrolase [Polyangiaceae bacterium]|nr:N-formylglutamate amidohydrolase [Polyangiaceae bacterium]